MPKARILVWLQLNENAIRRTPLWPVTTEDHYSTIPQFAVDAYHLNQTIGCTIPPDRGLELAIWILT